MELITLRDLERIHQTNSDEYQGGHLIDEIKNIAKKHLMESKQQISEIQG